MSGQSSPPEKTLAIRQTWFLAVSALFVILMFAFVILPYVDPKKDNATVAGQPAQDFDLELLSGGETGERIRLSDLRGKNVVLDFWASWCKPCRQQSHEMAQAKTELGDDTYLLGIATSDDRASALDYLNEAHPPYSNAFDADGLLGRAYQVEQLPTVVLVDKAGQIRGRFSRILDKGQIVDLVQQMGAE